VNSVEIYNIPHNFNSLKFKINISYFYLKTIPLSENMHKRTKTERGDPSNNYSFRNQDERENNLPIYFPLLRKKINIFTFLVFLYLNFYTHVVFIL